jgi:hypothetical protein
MTTDAGSGFDNQAAGRDAGDDRLEEESRHVLGEDAGADALEEESRHLPGEDAGDGALEEERERRQSRGNVNDAF